MSRRWERDFYNGYGNYSGFRFQDWCARCPHLKQTGHSWDCHHPARASENNALGVDCCLQLCPSVEVDGDPEQYRDWSDAETPVLMRHPYVWNVKTRLPERRGQRFRVVVRGKMNSALIEFESGGRYVTSRNYLRKAKQ